VASKAFENVWNELSPVQKKAAEWNEGSMLVLAGPGSGKTRVMTCRIARILDSTQGKNFRILALTFTNPAADEMRSRVENYVPGEEGRFFIGTFHSFCADILRQHGTHLNINPNFNIYSQDADLQAILSDVAEKIKENFFDISDLNKKVLPVIQRLKSSLILPEECREKFKDRQFGEKIALIYDAYEKELTERNALDFNSLILKTYQLFAKYPAFAKRYRTVYPYICIDEFQDTNHAQYSLIRAITGDSFRNIFIVADDDQIIYQWNGASHNRIRDFRNDFSPEVIQLPDNYRCPPEIVECANNLIRNNLLRITDKQPLKAFRCCSGDDNTLRLLIFHDFTTEAAEVAKDIKLLHHDHLSSVAVLGRSRKLLEGVEKALKIEGLSGIILQRKDEFQSSPFVWLHSVLRVVGNGQNRSYLEAVCGSFAQLTEIKIDPEQVIARFHEMNLGYLHHWTAMVTEQTENDSVRNIINELSDSLVAKRDFQSFSRIAIDWFDSLIKEGHDPSAEVFAGYEEERGVWEDLFRKITGYSVNSLSLEAFLQEIQMYSKEPRPDPDTVPLMTIHGAKGKEFDHVYLIGLAEDELPSFQSIKKGDNSPEMEEERRNCFVAITRTGKTLTLSYADRYRGWTKKPSRFLSEMGFCG